MEIIPDPLEIRGDGRAGSGLVMTLQSLAAMAVADPALHVQEWPFFSAARKGAPTRGFIRLSGKPIEKNSEITHPHISLMMDEGVSKMVDFAEGVSPGSIFILNSPRTPEEAAEKFKLTGRVYTIDGDRLAQHYLKKPLGNISVLALLVEILPGFGREVGEERLKIILKKRRLPEGLIQANLDLFSASFGQARFADCNFATDKDHRLKPFRGYGELSPGAQSGLRLSRSIKTAAYAKSGAVLEFADPQNLCNGCGHCIINCPENIIQFHSDPEIGVRVTGADIKQYCKLCKECITICPKFLFKEGPVK